MIHDFPKGLTVKELKALISDWPELDAMGDPSEVWIATGENLSSPVIEVSQLNSTDLIFDCSGKAWLVGDSITAIIERYKTAREPMGCTKADEEKPVKEFLKLIDEYDLKRQAIEDDSLTALIVSLAEIKDEEFVSHINQLRKIPAAKGLIDCAEFKSFVSEQMQWRIACAQLRSATLTA